jgi:hypothetical protein
VVTLGFGLTMPVDQSTIPDFDKGCFASNASPSPSSFWLDKTPAQILDDMNALLANINETCGLPLEYLGYPMEGVPVPKQACDWFRQWEQQRLVRLLLVHRCVRRPMRFTVKEKK